MTARLAAVAALPPSDDARPAAADQRRAAGSDELERLLVRAAAGSDDAWTQLVQRFTPRLRAIARAHRLGAHDVEDVVQTTWLELLKYIGRLREPEKIGGWLHATARHASVRVATAARRDASLDDVFEEPSVPPEADARLEAAERKAALADALRALPEQHRRLVEMLFADREPSYADISATLDIPIGSIGPTRARCLERLRRQRCLVSVRMAA
jgi:RNA polymerase sigma factor (sigma-70 family)